MGIRRKGIAAFALALLAANGALAGAPIPPELEAAALLQGSARAIVRLAPAPSRADRRLREDAALARLGAATRGGARRYENFPLLALDASPSELWALAAAPEVIGIEVDRLAAPTLDTTGPLVGATLATQAGFDGSGVAVAILDTGVDLAHPFFAGRIVAEACFSAGASCPNGSTTQVGPGAGAACSYSGACFHGTHVAGIAAGADATYQGVAPAAQLVAIQIFSQFSGGMCAGTGYDPCALAYASDIIAGIDHAQSLAGLLPLVAANLSVGSGRFPGKSGCDNGNVATKAAIDALLAVGVASVAAAGNDGWPDAMNAPACISSAIGVGATTDADAVASFSNSMYMLDLFAPGVTVRSARAGGGTVFSTGTSMATPQVTGALAVLRQADPAATIADLLGALQSTGVPITDTRTGASGLTRARIQLDTAIKSRAPAACYDGFDNDNDGRIDFPEDFHCGSGLGTTERIVSSCGIGPELVLVVPLLALARRRVRRR